MNNCTINFFNHIKNYLIYVVSGTAIINLTKFISINFENTAGFLFNSVKVTLISINIENCTLNKTNDINYINILKNCDKNPVDLNPNLNKPINSLFFFFKCKISGNRIYGNNVICVYCAGGIFFVKDSSFKLDNSEFKFNIGFMGGVIFLQNPHSQDKINYISNTNFSNNYAEFGAGVFIENYCISLTNLQFIKQKAKILGGELLL